MSQTEYTQSTWDEITANDNDVSDEEYQQSVKGNLQLAEEEPKANRGNLPGFVKFAKGEEKTLYFPKRTSDGSINAGKPVYKVYLENLPDKNKNLVHEKLEDFDTDEKYQTYGEGKKPGLRYYVEVVELTPQGSRRATFDMAKTKYDLVFREFLTPDQRILTIKMGKNSTDAPIVKYPSAATLKALLPKSK
jgi:hypothetical protein